MSSANALVSAEEDNPNSLWGSGSGVAGRSLVVVVAGGGLVVVVCREREEDPAQRRQRVFFKIRGKKKEAA
ncbi:hypothetical protein ACE6H2_027677 [Prunus campanulata]